MDQPQMTALNVDLDFTYSRLDALRNVQMALFPKMSDIPVSLAFYAKLAKPIALPVRPVFREDF